MPRGQKIPGSLQLKTGKYNVEIGDDTVTVHVTSCESIVESFIDRFVSQLAAERKDIRENEASRKTTNYNTKFIEEPKRFDPLPVGIDCRFRYRTVKSLSRYVILSLPKKNNQTLVLVAHIRGKKLWSSLKNFLEDQIYDYISLIGERDPHKLCFDLPENTGIRAGELVARVNKQEALYSCKDLEKVAEEAGVDYDKSVADGGVVSPTCSRYWEGQIFTQDEIKSLVYKAYICRKIGEKLMKKLSFR